MFLGVFFTVSDISKSFSPSNWFTFEPLDGPAARFLFSIRNNGLLKRFGTVDVLGIISPAMTFKMEVNKHIGSPVSLMAD